MGNQDNIFEQFRKAAKNQELQNFPGMEKVWSRVDAKLDTEVFKAQKKTNTNWKKFAIAASIVVGSVFAFQLLKEFEVAKEPIQDSVVESKKKKKNSTIANDSTAIVITKKPMVDDNENEKTLHQQIRSANHVAVTESKKIIRDSVQIRSMAAPAIAEEKAHFSSGHLDITSEKKSGVTENDDQAKEETAKSASVSRKAAPLVVVDGKATDKKVSDVKNSDDLETIVELKEPLYIINGKEYSEKELFGPNPTSPYYPLNKQEIESISIYQDDEAIELYGEKGNKGVVVIKTKKGRPAVLKK